MKIPEITVQQLAQKLQSDADFVLLDVRERWELQHAAIRDRRVSVIPVSHFTAAEVNALAEQAAQKEIYVLCHHGVRSASVTAYLSKQCFPRVFSVQGGIQAYAMQVDASVGTY